MVLDLKEPAVVVVHNASMRGYVDRMLRDLRGCEFAARCRVVVVDGQSEINRLRGGRLPLAVDHAFYQYSPIPLATELELLLAASYRAVA